MKFPPILHRPALFCLFGLIVIAVIGGAIHWVSFKEWLRSWQEMIGALIASGATIVAILLANKATKESLESEIRHLQNEEKGRDRRQRKGALCQLHTELEERSYVIITIWQDALRILENDLREDDWVMALNYSYDSLGGLPNFAYVNFLSVIGNENADIRISIARTYSRTAPLRDYVNATSKTAPSDPIFLRRVERIGERAEAAAAITQSAIEKIELSLMNDLEFPIEQDQARLERGKEIEEKWKIFLAEKKKSELLKPRK